MKPIKFHTFRGKKFRLLFLEPKKIGYSIDGECDSPKSKCKTIKFRNKYKSPKNELETYLHEALHAMSWDLSEDAVYEIARDMADWLWRIGYRKCP